MTNKVNIWEIMDLFDLKRSQVLRELLEGSVWGDGSGDRVPVDGSINVTIDFYVQCL